MTHVVSCTLPPAVESYLSETYKRAPYSCLLEAAKRYTGTYTSAEASNKATALAVERGCTKTEIYRQALIAFDYDIAKLWPGRPMTPGLVDKSRRLMGAENMVKTAGDMKADRAIRKLQALRTDLPTLNTRRALERIDAIIRILETQR